MARKLLLLSILTTAVSTLAATGTWKIDPSHSAAQFSVKHLGISTVRGAFTKMSGVVQYDPADPKTASVEATIEAASVDTRVEFRDRDLRSPNFFDVAKFPTLSFKSKRVEIVGGKTRLIGDLTMHGVTREVALDLDGPTTPMKGPGGQERVGVTATTTLDRNDFGISGAQAIVGAPVSITLDLELVRDTAPALPASNRYFTDRTKGRASRRGLSLFVTVARYSVSSIVIVAPPIDASTALTFTGFRESFATHSVCLSLSDESSTL